MNEQKAIEMLEYIKHVGNREQEYKHCAEEIALNIAIDALKLQIAEKPVVTSRLQHFVYCPNCDERIDWNQKYCDCGQKLDWSEV